MIQNYLKIALRGFSKHKLFTLINIVGLSIGISAAVVIYLIVHYDFTFDKDHRDSDRIYRVVSNYTFQGDESYSSGVCGPLTNAIKNQVTGVALTAPLYMLSDVNVLIPGKDNVPVKFKKLDKIVLADQQYFKLFDYTWLAGSPKSALQEPNKVVLTSDQAKVYFPKLSYTDMIGKIVTYDSIKTTVTGIVQTMTQNTDFTFHDFISYNTYTTSKDIADQLTLNQWGSTNSAYQVFIKLMPAANIKKIETQLNAILQKNHPPTAESKGSTTEFALQPLSDIHFNKKYGVFDFSDAANKNTLYGLLVIAAFLLLLGCINFINLTTAQATQRAKEIGIRKTMGSTRAQLIIQFLSETFILTTVAVIISVLLAPVILKLFADFIAPGIKADFIHQPDLIVFLVLLTIVVSLLSGFYPAIMLSAYKPVSVLKNQAQSNSSKTRNALLRKSLTVSQFVIAQFFIMATILVSKQIYYALHKDLGFKKDAIVVIQTPYKTRTLSTNLVFMDKLRAMSQIELVSMGGDAPSSGGIHSTDAVYTDGKKEIKVELAKKYADENYIKVYHIKLLAGRNIMPTDTNHAMVVNATYTRVLGFKNPADALGRQISFGDVKKWSIVGVVADFHEHSLRKVIAPLAIIAPVKSSQQGYFHIALKPQTAGGEEWKKTIAGMKTVWTQLYPDDDFDYSFFDEAIAKFYNNEQHTSTLLTWATGLSIFISCLGLLGLAIYTTGQRTKEIGVRKVLGASVAQIVRLLSTELIWLIVLSLIIVTPAAWWVMNKWMESYADRTPISWWIFAASGGGMLLTAIFTSSFQTVRAAIANPVKSLRSE